MSEENNNKEDIKIEQPAVKEGQEEKRIEDSGKVEVVEGKATPTDETAGRIQKIQQADPAAQTTSEPTDSPAAEIKEDQAEQEAKRKAAEAREIRAKERAAAKAKEEVEVVPKPPSPNQPRLDRIVQIIRESISADAVEEGYINENDCDVPTLTIRNEYWFETAIVLKEHPELNLNYMRNVSGVDQETHMEVVYHAICLRDKLPYVFKVKTDRDQPSIASVTSIWQTANWNEREIYDLLGIDFPGHPDLRRIMMSDDWIGHPLRKDYEPADPEV